MSLFFKRVKVEMYSGLVILSTSIVASSLNLDIAFLASSYKKPLVKTKLISSSSPFMEAVSA